MAKVKHEPDSSAAAPGISNGESSKSKPNTQIKKEPKGGPIDLTGTPDAGDEEAEMMFGDVDGTEEIVDLTYEGIAEIDGVDHFVCEGLSRYLNMQT